ncbi:toll/interleukin-1 receptor domain-containing protein [Sphingomonas sp.]|uniref:toll/interleukin-1 receptor domain-containing protein n=1 Tax=Sphingomonas sp. TaxID=28214 RepID=UPI0025E5A8DE|nr:toll/interleukin-1 receptor domain-containing protein [Sphingomonas sp.]
MTDNPKVFISYSWDSENHKKWVRELAERLVSNGVVVHLDQWNVVPGDSLTAFMEEQVSQCDFILVICTPNYATKSVKRTGGVGYEQQIISGQIAAGVERRKFIPIVREGDFSASERSAIPPHFLGIYAIDMRSESAMDDQIEGLLRAIYKVPAITAPPLGSKPTFALSSSASTRPTRAARLAAIEFDGYHLLSGVVMNEQYPDTFSIPPAEARSAVIPSDFVKLAFEVAVDDPRSDVGVEVIGERMWVRVEGSYGPYIWGNLFNMPSFGGEEIDLTHGSEVVFLPEHIIDIVDAESQKKDEAAYLAMVEEKKKKKPTSKKRK